MKEKSKENLKFQNLKLRAEELLSSEMDVYKGGLSPNVAVCNSGCMLSCSAGCTSCQTSCTVCTGSLLAA